MTVSLSIQGSELDFKIDTGADISVISENTFSRLKFKPKLSNVNANFESPGGKLHCKGQFTATTTVKDKQFRMMLNHSAQAEYRKVSAETEPASLPGVRD